MKEFVPNSTQNELVKGKGTWPFYNKIIKLILLRSYNF